MENEKKFPIGVIYASLEKENNRLILEVGNDFSDEHLNRLLDSVMQSFEILRGQRKSVINPERWSIVESIACPTSTKIN